MIWPEESFLKSQFSEVEYREYIKPLVEKNWYPVWLNKAVSGEQNRWLIESIGRRGYFGNWEYPCRGILVFRYRVDAVRFSLKVDTRKSGANRFQGWETLDEL